MPNTYSQISIHVVFAVRGRENTIVEKFRSRLFEYISGVVAGCHQKPLAVNGWKDYVHIFFGMEPSVSISNVVRDVKANSSKWVNEHRFLKGKFQWQEGFAALSYSKSQRNQIIHYILNQEQHHKKQSFREEYMNLLNAFEIDYNEKYLFEFYE